MAGKSGKGVFKWNIGIPASLKALPKVFGDFSNDLSDYKETLRQVPPILAEMTRRTIASGSGPDGQTWSTYSKTYIKRKQRSGFGTAELMLTGKLMGQVTSQTGGRLNIRKNSLLWGTKNLDYAAAVNFGYNLTGSKQGVKTKVGSRWFFGWTRDGKAKVKKLLDKSTQEKVAKLANQIKGLGGLD